MGPEQDRIIEEGWIEEEELIEESAEPELLSHLQYQYRNPTEAVLDILDNSLDARVEGRPLLIYINYDGKRLTISDRGGKGMGREELETFFKWGISKKRGMLGRYGFGGKAAMSYLARSFEIKCIKDLDKFIYKITEPDFDDRTAGFKKYRPLKRAIQPSHGTVQIELENLKRRINSEKLLLALKDTYRLAILDRKVTINFNGKEISPLEIPIEGEPFPFEFRLMNGVEVKGWIGKLPKDKETEINPGIRGSVFGRKIADGIFFGHPEPHKEPGTRFLIGEFNIDSENFPLTSGKNDFDRGSDVWEDLEVRMYFLLEPIIAELKETKEKPRFPRGDRPAIDRAFNAIRLGLVALGEITYGVRQPEEKREEREKGKGKKRGKYLPRTPAPRGAVGERKRLGRGGFIKIICRDLGVGTRSSVVEEEGRKILVICPNFPGYRAMRDKGALELHIIETAALELAKPRVEEEIPSDLAEKMVDKEKFNRYYQAFIKAGKRAGLL